MRENKNSKNKTLGMWIIDHVDGEVYRAGTLTGMKHPRIDEKMIRQLGGWNALKSQVQELEKAGYIDAEWSNMGADLKKIDFSIEIVPKLCERENVEDPRRRQIRLIQLMEQRKSEVADTFLSSYYEEILEKLKIGKRISKIDLEDESFFFCLEKIVRLNVRIWKRVFSAYVFGKSKTFEEKYEDKVVGLLQKISPLYEEGMEKHEILEAHGILTYATTMEWKGSLQYELEIAEGKNVLIDSSDNRYGTILNEQTLEKAEPVSVQGIHRVMIIENKANYEDMDYDDDTLYIYCHGFFSPKERIFLKKLVCVAAEDMEYYHWGDMDFGGIRIFLYNKKEIFPGLKPYRMDVETFQKAVDKGAGIELDGEKREKLENMDGEELEDLKQCILTNNIEIEQEILLAHEKL